MKIIHKRNTKNVENAFLIGIDEARERYQICKNQVYKFAREADALVKIGKSSRIVKDKMDAYFMNIGRLKDGK